MTVEVSERGDTLESGVAPASTDTLTIQRGAVLRGGIAVIILLGILVAAYALHAAPEYGAAASFSLLIGAAVGIVFQRGRFCFFCILRDYIEFGKSGAIYAILTALAVGGIGYAVLFGAFLPNAFSGRLPATAHIGPASWVLVLAGAAFGVGMALSGACISGHLYRLGEGYSRAPFALFGSLIGFALGFLSWQTLYINAIAAAPIPWLPATFGYGGALAIHLAVLAIIGIFLLRWLPPLPAREGGRVTLIGLYRRVFGERWHPVVSGSLVGAIGVLAYFRVEPLGVTAQLGSISRTMLANNGILEGRLPGLDTFAGCATQVIQAITDNGWLIGGLVVGSLAVALLANNFQISRLTISGAITATGGGVLMGWGAMLALGCTVGTLLSGISAFALSGWIFGAAVFAGVWLGIRLRLHRWG